MIPIDLKVYADHAQKIPASLLAPKNTRKKPHLRKILVCHGLDFFLILWATSFLATLATLSLAPFMITSEVERTLSQISPSDLIFSFFPLMLFCYFFFCYFMNDGQSLGMLLLKSRIKIDSKHIRHSLTSATYSTLLCLSGGVLFFTLKKIQNTFASHDHLYHDLMIIKDQKVLSLVHETQSDEFEESEQLAA